MMADINSLCDLRIEAPQSDVERVVESEKLIPLTPGAANAPGAGEHVQVEDEDQDGPSLEEVLDEDREPSGAEPSVKFRDAGTDFHYPRLELAVLSVLLNRPAQVARACQELDAGDFYQENAYVVFQAILDLQNQGKAVTPGSVLLWFQAAFPDAMSELTPFVNACAAAKSNFKDLPKYIKKLKEAAGYRGGKDYCPRDYSEEFCTQLFMRRFPRLRCVERTWYQYGEGIWSQSDINLLMTEALNVIHPAHRQSKRASDVLRHVEFARQVRRDSFVGAYRRAADGRILINAQNCVIEVQPDGTISTLEHSPDFNFTQKLATVYDSNARCDLFAQKVEEALPDPEDRAVFQAFGGYIFYPSCELEVALVCYGPGGTGKSTLAGIFGEAVGRELCGSAGLDELCKSGSYTLPTLKHKLLNLGSELTGTEIEESANFKKLVSGEHLSVRQIYGAPEEMQTFCKLLFLTNLPPRFRSGTDAEARRLRILAFNVKPAVKDVALKEKLKLENPGILNWMLEGLQRVVVEKAIPFGGTSSAAAMDNFKRANDPVGSFIEECCETGSGKMVIKRELYEAFREWCEDAGLDGNRWESFFYKTLKQRRPELGNTRRLIEGKREHCLLGIALKDSVPFPGSGLSVGGNAKLRELKERAKQLRVQSPRPES